MDVLCHLSVGALTDIYTTQNLQSAEHKKLICHNFEKINLHNGQMLQHGEKQIEKCFSLHNRFTATHMYFSQSGWILQRQRRVLMFDISTCAQSALGGSACRFIRVEISCRIDVNLKLHSRKVI